MAHQKPGFHNMDDEEIQPPEVLGAIQDLESSKDPFSISGIYELSRSRFLVLTKTGKLYILEIMKGVEYRCQEVHFV